MALRLVSSLPSANRAVLPSPRLLRSLWPQGNGRAAGNSAASAGARGHRILFSQSTASSAPIPATQAAGLHTSGINSAVPAALPAIGRGVATRLDADLHVDRKCLFEATIAKPGDAATQQVTSASRTPAPAAPTTISSSGSTDDMHIVEYVNHVWATADSNFEALCGAFEAQGFTAGCPSAVKRTSLEGRFLRLGYLGNAKVWRPRWARQTRGTMLHLDPATNAWRPLKFMMPRGAEVLTTSHLASGITETQDVHELAIGVFHPEQQDIMRRLMSGAELPAPSYMSSKVDGGMLTATLYGGTERALMEQVIQESGDAFATSVADLCRHLPYLLVFASQNTLLLGPDMQDYAATAVVGVLQPQADLENLTPAQAMMAYAGPLVEALQAFGRGTVAFEAVCPNRTTAWGRHHSMLAISYKAPLLHVLGFAYAGENGEPRYTPHMHMDVSHLRALGVGEPLAWPVADADVEKLLHSLNDVVFGRQTAAAFLQRHVPIAPQASTTAAALTTQQLDYEGFILFTGTASSGSGGSSKQLCYSKVKTEAYYKAHMVRTENLPYLRALAATAGHVFPAARFVADFDEALPAKWRQRAHGCCVMRKQPCGRR